MLQKKHSSQNLLTNHRKKSEILSYAVQGMLIVTLDSLGDRCSKKKLQKID